MITINFITELFCRVDDEMKDIPKHPQASLYPSEIVTLGFLFALKGVGNRAFYRWVMLSCRMSWPQDSGFVHDVLTESANRSIYMDGLMQADRVDGVGEKSAAITPYPRTKWVPPQHRAFH
jgi:hypothetical protein